MKSKKDFLNNKIEKYDYMERMFDVHKVLYEYAKFIDKSNVLDITIKDGDVYFNFLSNGIRIKMVCIPYDITSVPFTFLDFGSYDMEETAVLSDIVKDNYVVLDIGANLGWYTLHWLKKTKEATVFSFEPMPDTYDKLVRNLILNGQEIKNAFNFGLSNINDEVEFFWDTERCGASSMVNLRGTNKTVKVKCTVKRLDDVFLSLGVNRLDFIKCDVEGAEKLVFEGGIETIKKYTPIIYSEMLRKWSKKFSYHPDDIINLLADIGYHCYGYINNKIEKIDSVTPELETTNFFFFHETKHKKTIETLPVPYSEVFSSEDFID